jgi:hypothetical protein
LSCKTKKWSIKEVLSKDKIEMWIVPHLRKGSRGTKESIEVWRIIAAILYRLNSGSQWRMLPVEQFFTPEQKLRN